VIDKICRVFKLLVESYFKEVTNCGNNLILQIGKTFEVILQYRTIDWNNLEQAGRFDTCQQLRDTS